MGRTQAHDAGGRGLWSGVALALVAVVGFFGLAELLLALAGVDPAGSPADWQAGLWTRRPVFVRGQDDAGRSVFATAPDRRRFFNPQQFAAEKPKGSRRLFCVGGSTTYGRPFDDATSFCGWLRRLLAAADPGQSWEVVNAGAVSYASYRVAAVVEEIAHHDADVLVVYTGHNEFLERRTWPRMREASAWLYALDDVLRRTRLYSSLRAVIERRSVTRADGPPDEVDALLDRSIGLDAYTRDDELRDRVLGEYRIDLESIVRTARRGGALPILVVPASNAKDCGPFKSEHSQSLDEASRARWDRHFALGRLAYEEGRLAQARESLGDALRIDPRRADAHYLLGRVLDAQGDREAAARSFRTALDEDVCPLRVLAPMADAVREVARLHEALLVDFPKLLAESSGAPALGAGEFLDHVHPTPEVHGVLAYAIFEALQGSGLVQGVVAPETREAIAAEMRALLGPRRRGLALRNLAKVQSWAGKGAEAAEAAHSALELLGPDAEAEFILGVRADEQGRHAQAVEHYRAALALEPDYVKARNNLGISLANQGRLAEAIEAYERVLRDDPDHTGARFNLANALARSGRLDAAIASYREVLRVDPSDADAHFNLARAYERRGDDARAADHYRAVLGERPDAVDAQRALAALRDVPVSP